MGARFYEQYHNSCNLTKFYTARKQFMPQESNVNYTGQQKSCTIL